MATRVHTYICTYASSNIKRINLYIRMYLNKQSHRNPHIAVYTVPQLDTVASQLYIAIACTYNVTGFEKSHLRRTITNMILRNYLKYCVSGRRTDACLQVTIIL